MTQRTLFDTGPDPPPPRPRAESSEEVRRDSNRARVLDALMAGPRTGTELATIAGHRFGARVEELRRLGWKIDAERIANGVFRYTLIREETRP
jgi:hypothetical protein